MVVNFFSFYQQNTGIPYLTMTIFSRLIPSKDTPDITEYRLESEKFIQEGSSILSTGRSTRPNRKHLSSGI